jgi:hypothetical protein
MARTENKDNIINYFLENKEAETINSLHNDENYKNSHHYGQELNLYIDEDWNDLNKQNHSEVQQLTKKHKFKKTYVNGKRIITSTNVDNYFQIRKYFLFTLAYISKLWSELINDFDLDPLEDDKFKKLPVPHQICFPIQHITKEDIEQCYKYCQTKFAPFKFTPTNLMVKKNDNVIKIFIVYALLLRISHYYSSSTQDNLNGYYSTSANNLSPTITGSYKKKNYSSISSPDNCKNYSSISSPDNCKNYSPDNCKNYYYEYFNSDYGSTYLNNLISSIKTAILNDLLVKKVINNDDTNQITSKTLKFIMVDEIRFVGYMNSDVDLIYLDDILNSFPLLYIKSKKTTIKYLLKTKLESIMEHEEDDEDDEEEIMEKEIDDTEEDDGEETDDNEEDDVEEIIEKDNTVDEDDFSINGLLQKTFPLNNSNTNIGFNYINSFKYPSVSSWFLQNSYARNYKYNSILPFSSVNNIVTEMFSNKNKF